MAEQQENKTTGTGAAGSTPAANTTNMNNAAGTNKPTGSGVSTGSSATGEQRGTTNKEPVSGRTEATSGTGAAAATARSFYDQAKETAGEAYDVVTDKAATKLEEQKSTLTDGLSTVADTIRQAGDALGNPQNKSGLTDTAAKYTDTAAEKIEQAAKYFEQRDVKQMVRDVEGYARRNPAVFIGAAFAVGVLLARFMKAGTPNYVNNSGENFKLGSGSTPNTSAGSGTSGSNVRDFGGNSETKNRSTGTPLPGDSVL